MIWKGIYDQLTKMIKEFNRSGVHVPPGCLFASAENTAWRQICINISEGYERSEGFQEIWNPADDTVLKFWKIKLVRASASSLAEEDSYFRQK